MTIEKIGALYIGKARFGGSFFTAVELTRVEVLKRLFQDIAIYRSAKAWESFNGVY